MRKILNVYYVTVPTEVPAAISDKQASEVTSRIARGYEILSAIAARTVVHYILVEYGADE